MLNTSIMPTGIARNNPSCCSERAKAQLRTIGYSAAEGLSAGASVGYSLFACGWSLPVCAVVGVTAAAVRFGSSYCFNGSSIMGPVSMEKTGTQNYAYHSEEVVPLITPRPSCAIKFVSIFAQATYLTLDTGQSFTDRFFLLTAILESVGRTLNPETFYAILISELAIKQLFNMTNETYETVEKIAQKFITDAKAFYGPIFIPISGKISREIFRVIGSADHALVDDLVKWAPLYLSSGAATYLMSSEFVPTLLLTLCTTAGVVLGCSLFMLVYFFEGNHTVENIKGLINELDLAEVSYFPDIIINFFKCTIKLTPILHGLGSSTSVYYSLSMIISNSDVKLPISLFLAALTFIGTTEGTRCSEMKEALEELEKRRKPSLPTRGDS